jgi:hypothetical protein
LIGSRCGPCHAPAYSWAKKKASNPLFQSGHNGAEWSNTQKDLIGSWINGGKLEK